MLLSLQSLHVIKLEYSNSCGIMSEDLFKLHFTYKYISFLEISEIDKPYM